MSKPAPPSSDVKLLGVGAVQVADVVGQLVVLAGTGDGGVDDVFGVDHAHVVFRGREAAED